MHIAVDFDGTLFSLSNWPNIGIPNFALIEKIKKLKEQGHIIMLWTCRTNEALEQAKYACKSVGLEFDFINENDPARIKAYENDSRKIGADVYIDDRAIRPDELDVLLENQEGIWNIKF